MASVMTYGYTATNFMNNGPQILTVFNIVPVGMKLAILEYLYK